MFPGEGNEVSCLREVSVFTFLFSVFKGPQMTLMRRIYTDSVPTTSNLPPFQFRVFTHPLPPYGVLPLSQREKVGDNVNSRN